MKVVILGCGRTGAWLAQLMDQAGHNVTVIDPNQSTFSRLARSYQGATVAGVGIDLDVLKKAGIEAADAFVALTNGDNTNIMSCQMAKHIFQVPRVISQIKDPGRRTIYESLQLETICPTDLGVEAIRNALVAPR